MDNQLITAIIAFIQVIAVAVIGGMFQRSEKRNKKEREKADNRAASRAKESRLAMCLVSASAGLSRATAIAVKNNVFNGDTERALEVHEKAQREYFKYINELAAEQLTE